MSYTTEQVELILLRGFDMSSEETLLADVLAALYQAPRRQRDPRLIQLYFTLAQRVLPASRGRWARVRPRGRS